MALRNDTEQQTDLADLDDLLGQLDTMETDTAAVTDTVDELRGRIEILMDEIDISLGIEPTPIPGHADLDPDLDLDAAEDELPVRSTAERTAD